MLVGRDKEPVEDAALHALRVRQDSKRPGSCGNAEHFEGERWRQLAVADNEERQTACQAVGIRITEHSSLPARTRGQCRQAPQKIWVCNQERSWIVAGLAEL